MTAMMIQIQPAAAQAFQQLIADLLVLGGALMETQYGLGSRLADTSATTKYSPPYSTPSIINI